jgi:hypothetical protein
MAFADDLVTDVDSVYLNTAEMAEAISFRATGAAAWTATVAVPEDMPDTPGEVWRRWWVSAAVVTTPQRVNQIKDADGKVWTVRDVSQDELGMFGLDCSTAQERA